MHATTSYIIISILTHLRITSPYDSLPPGMIVVKYHGIKTTKRTFNATTQLGVRDYTYSRGTHRLRHTAYQFKF